MTWPTGNFPKATATIERIGVSVADAANNALSEELNLEGVTLSSADFSALEDQIRKQTRLTIKKLFWRAPEVD